MGAIPLPALSITPFRQEQPDLVGQISHILQLKNMLQMAPLQHQALQQQVQAGGLENQQRQMDMQSQQALMRAYTDANGDLEKAIPLAAQYGAKPRDLVDLKTAAIKQQEANLTLLKTKGERAFQEADMMQGAHDAVTAAPPEQRAAIYQQQLVNLSRAGIDVSQVPPQYPGDQQFAVMGVGLKGHKQQLEEMAQQTTLRKTTAEANKAEAEAKAMQDLGLPAGIPTDKLEMADWLKKNPGKTPSDFLVWKAKNSPMMLMTGNQLEPDALDMAAEFYRKTGTLPSGLSRSPQTIAAVIKRAAQQAKAEGGGSDIAANKVTYETQKAESKYMTSGKGGQQLTAFNTAIAHLDTLQRLADDLGNSDLQIRNRAAQAWAEQTGNPAPANFAAAKNAMSGEVAAALKASGATDQEINKVGETFNRAQSPAQLRGAISTYRELLNSKAAMLQKQYKSGMQGKPAFSTPENVNSDPLGIR